MLMIWSSRARNRSPDPVVSCFFGRIASSDAATESCFSIRGNCENEFASSRASDTETLQSQVNKAAKKRLSLSGLEILHGRLIEYSGKFPPPIRWSIEYDPNHQWDLTDYQGASLSLLADLLRAFSYSLVCCNGQTGVNAFFVRNEFMSKFADIPREIEDIFVECRYEVYEKWDHPASAKTIEQILRRGWESSGGTA
jgi:hypothetical protein